MITPILCRGRQMPLRSTMAGDPPAYPAAYHFHQSNCTSQNEGAVSNSWNMRPIRLARVKTEGRRVRWPDSGVAPEIGELHLTAALVASTASPSATADTAAQNGIEISCDGKVTTIKEFLTDWKLTGGIELTLRMAGGRGWGAPADRPPEQVRADVANDLVSAEAARYVYRVEIDPETFAINGILPQN